MIEAQWTLVTGPTLEPITIPEAKLHARISHTSEDGLLNSYIKTARETAEEYMSRGIYTQTWKLTLMAWADVIWLPRAAPLQSATVAYYDANNALQTLSTSIYDVDTVSRPGRIVRKANQNWPELASDRQSGKIEITYIIGWTTVALIPERIKHGIRMFVTYLDCDREGLEEYGAQARQQAEACWSDRVTWIEPETCAREN